MYIVLTIPLQNSTFQLHSFPIDQWFNNSNTTHHKQNVQGGYQLCRSTRPRNRTQKAIKSYAIHVEIDGPLTVQEALKSTHAIYWKQEMDVEYESLIQNQTWELISLPLKRE